MCFCCTSKWISYTYTYIASLPLLPLLPSHLLKSSQSTGLSSVCFTHGSVYTGEGNGTPLQSSCLDNPMDGGVWWAAVHGISKSWTRLSEFTFTFHFHALENEMAIHSSVLVWRIPGTGEPGGLPSMGSHRVGHDWSDLAAAAAAAVYICPCYSQCASPSSPTHTSLFPMSVSLFLSWKQAPQYRFSRIHIYVLIYDICFFWEYFYFTDFPGKIEVSLVHQVKQQDF